MTAHLHLVPRLSAWSCISTPSLDDRDLIPDRVNDCAMDKNPNTKIQTANLPVAFYGCETWTLILRKYHIEGM